nr:hypothetical protein [Kibdelosporangium sp. MJ126-NF4]CTQ91243.1 hypothetical protein [Kibdelosporangium sp. MJ126-NF4]
MLAGTMDGRGARGADVALMPISLMPCPCWRPALRTGR